MASKLHQLTMTYSPKEDRILLRIGTQELTEFRLWLTRRFVRNVWVTLLKGLEGGKESKKNLQPKVKEAIMAMEHQESLQSSDFSKKYSTENVNVTPDPERKARELEKTAIQTEEPKRKEEFKKDDPGEGAVLVIGGRIRALKNDLTQINFKLENGTGVEFTLNKKLLHALCHMIIKSSEKAGWGLGLKIGSSQVLVPKDLGQIH